MALAATLLTGNYDNVDRTSYTTASISPTANSSILLFYSTRHATTAPDLTPSGVSGITWTAVTSQVDGISRIGCWHGAVGGSPGTGALTLTIAGGVTAIGCSWHIIQVTGQDTSGTIVQSPVGATGSTGTSSSLTFAAAGASGNRFFSFHFHRANEATNPRTNWTELDDRAGSTPNGGSEVQWRNDGTNETTASASWTTSSRWQSMGVEVKNLAGGSVALDSTTGNDGVSTTTAEMIVSLALDATSGNGTSSTSADIVIAIALDATSGNGLSSTTADIILDIALSSTDANGISTTAPAPELTISGTVTLDGTADGASSTTADIVLTVALSSSDAAGVAGTIAELVVGAIVELDGSAAGAGGAEATTLEFFTETIAVAVMVPLYDVLGRKRRDFRLGRRRA